MSGTQVTLPSGTAIEVRVNESLSSDTTPQGERFTGTLTSDVTDPGTGRVVIPRDAEVTGRVLSATPSGRLSDSGELQLTINTIRYGSSVANVTVEPFVVKGESHTKSNTTKIGGGAALGAIIGAIAGGGKGAAIGAGVGGAAGAGTAAATGKRPAEVKPEALLKFVTSGEMTVTAASRMPDSSSSYPGTSSSQSSTWPEPSRPASTSQSTTTATTPASSDTGTISSDNPDAAPVLRRPDGSVATPPSPSTDNGAGTAATRNPTPSTTTTASSGTYGTSNPPATGTTGVYGSTTTGTMTGTTTPSTGTYGTTTSVGAGTAGSTTTSTTPSAPTSTTTTATTASLPDSRLFSARDRRVVNQCLKDNAASLPPSFLRKSATGYQRGQELPSDVQRQLRSLPLTCDRELPAVNNDLERVIYGGQVMLIDSSNRVLDVFDVAP
jgi:hypothetical protein